MFSAVVCAPSSALSAASARAQLATRSAVSTHLAGPADTEDDRFTPVCSLFPRYMCHNSVCAADSVAQLESASYTARGRGASLAVTFIIILIAARRYLPLTRLFVTTAHCLHKFDLFFQF